MHLSLREPEVVVLDIRLPDGDGRELCARLRRNGFSLPVIVASGLERMIELMIECLAGRVRYV